MIQARAELKRGRMGKRKVRPDGDEKKEARGKAEGKKKSVVAAWGVFRSLKHHPKI